MSQPRLILPAEWEPQDGVMITWPNADTDWAPYLTEITQTYLALAKIIAQHEKLIIAAQNPEHLGTRPRPYHRERYG